MVEVISVKGALLMLIISLSFQNPEPHQCLEQQFSAADQFCTQPPEGRLAMSGDIFNSHICGGVESASGI